MLHRCRLFRVALTTPVVDLLCHERDILSSSSDSDYPSASQRENRPPLLGTRFRNPSGSSDISTAASADALKQSLQLTTQLAATVQQQLERAQTESTQREQRMFNDIAEREHRLLADAAEREQRLLDDARHARELDAQREQILVRDAQSARQELLADIQLQRNREAQREIDMRRDLYDLSRQSSRAAALEAELNCLKANIGPPSVAPVQSADTAPPEINTAMQMPLSRPVSPIDNFVLQGLSANINQRRSPVSIIHSSDTAHALTSNPDATDVSTVCGDHAAGISTLRRPYFFSEIDEPTAQYTQPQWSDPGSTHHQRRRLPHLPVTTASDSVRTHVPEHTFSRFLPEPASTQSTVTSMMPPRKPTFLDPPARHDALTSALPRPPILPMHDAVTSALFDGHGMLTEQAYTHTPPHSQLHPFPRSLEPAGTQSTMTSALPRPPTVPGSVPTVDYTIQRPADRVDSRKMYTHSVEQLLADLPTPPFVPRQPILPLSSVRTQTTASDYVNTDPIPSLSAHTYADTPFHGTVPSLPAIQPTVHDYQNISANLSLPTVSTHTNVPTHVSAPLSYTNDSQRLPIAVEQAGLSAFSRVDVHRSRPAAADSTIQYDICTSATADRVRPTVTAHLPPLPSPSVHWSKRFAYDYIQPDTGLGAPTHTAPAIHSGYIRPQTSDTPHTQNSVHLQTTSFGDGQPITSVGPPRPPPPPSSYVPHSHMMPLQVPTVPSAVPPSSHLPFQVPISSSSETNVTYLHVPQTHTVYADVHAPFTHESLDASAGASIVSSQPQSTTVTTQSHSVMYTQSKPNSAVNFNALPTGLTATADTVVPPPTAMPPPMPPTTVHGTPVVTELQSFVQSVPTFIVKQPQMPKPYSGVTSYQSFKEHFERICRVNAWTSTEGPKSHFGPRRTSRRNT